MNIIISIIAYSLCSIAVFTKLKPKPYSFAFLFFCYTFITYFCAFFLFQKYPEYSTLIPLPNPREGEFFNFNYMADSLSIFVTGVISFYIPFFIIKKIKLKKELNTSFNINFPLSLIGFLTLNIVSFFIRKHFQVGVPIGKPTNKIAEYSWYIFDYSTLIFLILVIYKGITSRQKSKFIISILATCCYGTTLILLGWKSGFIWMVLFWFHLLFFARDQKDNLKKKINKRISIFLVISIFSIPIIFVAGNSYRNYAFSNNKVSINNSKNILTDSIKKSFNSSNIIYIFNRITGISPLFVSTAYHNTAQKPKVVFWKNLIIRGSYQPETYFGCEIIKRGGACPPHFAITYAPTSWGTFYLYGGLFGVITGFLILGTIVSIFEKLIEIIIRNNENFIPLFTVIFSITLPAIIFEGTIVFFLKRHFLSFILAFGLILATSFTLNKIWHKNNKTIL